MPRPAILSPVFYNLINQFKERVAPGLFAKISEYCDKQIESSYSNYDDAITDSEKNKALAQIVLELYRYIFSRPFTMPEMLDSYEYADIRNSTFGEIAKLPQGVDILLALYTIDDTTIPRRGRLTFDLIGKVCIMIMTSPSNSASNLAVLKQTIINMTAELSPNSKTALADDLLNLESFTGNKLIDEAEMASLGLKPRIKSRAMGLAPNLPFEWQL